MVFRFSVPREFEEAFAALDQALPTPGSRGAAEAQLYLRFPGLFRLRHMERPRMPISFEMECRPGWWPIIWRLCENLEREACREWLSEHDDQWPAFRQIKEKYGTLKAYLRGNDRMRTLAKAAELCSARTGEVCGASGILRDEHAWVETLCDRCAASKDPWRQSRW
ncbi:MAG TPA: hypothetical protein VFA48_07815 [Gammaproteobacteria bacterium]|nr:hypothetical protein [Gammaproteobacteria bacterium]